MSKHLQEEFNSICRACSCKHQNLKHLNASISNEHPREVHVMLQLLTPQLSVELNDELPQQICDPCFDQLEKAYGFQQMCIKSEEEFHRIVRRKTVDPLFTNLLVIPEEIKDNDLHRNRQVETIAGDTLAIFVADDEERAQSDKTTKRPRKLHKTFRCTECDKSFGWSQNFRRHQKLHSKQRPFACNFCTFRFTRESLLSSHLTSHHSENTTKKRKSAHTTKHSKNPLTTHKSKNELKSSESSECCKSLNHQNLHSNWQEQNQDQIVRQKTMDPSFTNVFLNQEKEYVNKIEIEDENPVADDVLAADYSANEKTQVQPDKTMQRHQKWLEIKQSERPHEVDILPTKLLSAQEECLNELKSEEDVVTIAADTSSGNSSKNNETNMQSQQLPNYFECAKCGKCLYKLNNFRRHLKLHSKEHSKFQCIECEKSFKRKQNLVRHQQLHSKERAFACNFCNYRFTKESLLSSHLAIHLGKKASNKQNTAHTTKHSNSPLTTECSKSFNHQSLHSNRQVEDQDQTVRQKVMDPSFANVFVIQVKELMNEIKIEDEDPITVDVSAVNWSVDEQTQTQPDKTMPIHQKSQSKMLELEQIEAADPLHTKLLAIHQECLNELKNEDQVETTAPDASSSNVSKNNETKLQSQELPNYFECAKCGQSFNKKNNFWRHQKFHSKERSKFQCIECEKSFNRKQNFVRHQQLHSKERAFACNFCNYRFTKESLLSSHLNSHHGANATKKQKTAHTTKYSKNPLTTDRPQNELKSKKSTESSKSFNHQSLQSNRNEQEQGQIVQQKVMDSLFANVSVTQEKELFNELQYDNENPLTDDVSAADFSEDEETQAQPNKAIKRSQQLLKKFDCPGCEKKFHKKQNLLQHQKMHSKERPFACNFCNFRFTRQSFLSSHLNSHLYENKKRCAMEKQNPNNDGYRLEKDELTKQKKFRQIEEGNLQCVKCNETFTTIAKLNKHIILQHNDDENKLTTFDCDQCTRTFLTETLLKTHLNCHKKKDSNEQEHKCYLCQEVFSKRGVLNYHIRSQHKNAMYSCTGCDRQFKQLCALKIHMQSHSAERPIQCEKCPMKFKSMAYLSKHRNVHRERDEHKCDVCGKGLCSLLSLLVHKRLHQNIRPYQCEQCGKRFMRRANLSSHLIRHKVVIYNCKYCSRSFRNTGDLLRHKRGHFGGYLYRCQQCTEKFKYQKELLKHESEHFLQQTQIEQKQEQHKEQKKQEKENQT